METDTVCQAPTFDAALSEDLVPSGNHTVEADLEASKWVPPRWLSKYTPEWLDCMKEPNIEYDPRWHVETINRMSCTYCPAPYCGAYHHW